MGLRGYILKRSINTVILIFFVITVNFVLFELMPGTQGSIEVLASSGRIRSEEQYHRLLNLYGFCNKEIFALNKTCVATPTHERYLTYVVNMLTFQFGISYQTGHEVVEDIVESGRLANTVLLIGTSSLLSIILGILLGVFAAHKRGGLFDSTSVSSSLLFYALPTFWMGLIFLFIFYRSLGWFPVGGVIPFEWVHGRPDILTEIVVRLQHLFLPTLTLTLFSYGGFLLLTRATMLETLSEDYIATARAKGLKERTVLFKHGLKNASLPIVTETALVVGTILTGALITETVFSWNGLGHWLWQAIGWKDFPVLQAMFYLIALAVIFANFAADIVYGMIDPRIKYE